MTDHRTKHGISRIEILVIVVVIGVLAALFLPAFLGTPQHGNVASKDLQDFFDYRTQEGH